MNRTSHVAFQLQNGLICVVSKHSTGGDKMKVVVVRRKKVITFIIDVSGSMTSDIPELREFVKKWLCQLKAGDVCQLIWFSSKGMFKEFQTPVVIPEIITDEFINALKETVDAELKARALTCFGDALTHYAENTIPMLNSAQGKLLYGNHEIDLVFCTDGWHNDGSRETIYKAIEKCAPYLHRMYVIGFSSGYDGVLLKEMKNRSGCGVFAHCDDAKDMDIHMSNMIEETSIGECHIIPAVKDGNSVLNFFYSDDNKPTVINSDQNEIRFTGDNCTIVSLSKNVPAGAKLVKKMTKDIEQSLYMASALLLESQQTLNALRIIGTDVKDSALADTICISNTKTQYQIAIDSLIKAANDEGVRFVGGKSVFGGSTKPAQTFMFKWFEQKGCSVPPTSPEGYRHNGLKAQYPKSGEKVIIDGEEKIVPDVVNVSSEWVPFRLTEYPIEGINIIYTVTQLFDVMLRPEHRGNFANADRIEKVPVTREYILLDGSGCNSFPVLTIKCPTVEVLEEGKRLGIFAANATNLVQSIQLSKFPVVNVDWENPTVDSVAYATKVVDLNRLKAERSLYNKIQKELDVKRQDRFTADQLAILSSHYFVECSSTGKMSYASPFYYHASMPIGKRPGVKELAGSNTDFNMLFTFDSTVSINENGKGKAWEISIKSKLDEAYKNKLRTNKGNAYDTEVAIWFARFEKETAGMVEAEVLKYLQMKISVLDRKIKDVLEDLMDVKLSVIYGKKDFSGQTSREFSQDVVVENKKYTVAMNITLEQKYCGPYVPAIVA